MPVLLQAFSFNLNVLFFMKEGQQYVDLVWNTMESWYLKLAKYTPNFIVGLLVFLVIYFASAYLTKLAVRIFQKKFPKKAEMLASFVGFFRFLILLIGTFISLEIMNLSGFLWKFIGSLGVAGVIAGVALKDLVSSIFSGMLVGIDKAFKTGDYVTIASYTGTIEEIGFLTTKLITDEGKKIYIPNQLIFSSPFVNFSASGQRRIFIDLEIPSTEDLARTKEVLLDELRKIQMIDRADDAEVVILKQANGIFYLEARFWMKQGADLLQVRSEALVKLKSRLDSEGIPIAVPNSANA